MGRCWLFAVIAVIAAFVSVMVYIATHPKLFGTYPSRTTKPSSLSGLQLMGTPEWNEASLNTYWVGWAMLLLGPIFVILILYAVYSAIF